MRLIAKIGILLALVVALASLVIGTSASLGAAIHWLMPSVDFGLAIIIGLLSLLASLIVVVGGVKAAASIHAQGDNESDEEEEEEEDEQAELIAQHLAEELFNRFDVPNPIGRRRRR